MHADLYAAHDVAQRWMSQEKVSHRLVAVSRRERGVQPGDVATDGERLLERGARLLVALAGRSA